MENTPTSYHMILNLVYVRGGQSARDGNSNQCLDGVRMLPRGRAQRELKMDHTAHLY